MMRMVQFEWKKILKSKISLIAAAAGFFLLVFCVTVWLTQSNYYDAEKKEQVYGIETIRINQERERARAEVLTEEALCRMVETVQENAKKEGAESPEDYYVLCRDNLKVSSLLACTYAKSERDQIENNWRILGNISTEGGIRFYERRMEKIKEILNMSYSYGDYTPEEKEFWIGKAEKVKTPFLWGDTFAMSNVLDILGVSFYLLFVAAICISPIFASEYEAKADSLLFTTKFGKTRLIAAKIITALSFSLLYFLVCQGICLLLIAAVCGLDGAELPIQLWDTIIPYDWTAGKTFLVCLAVMLLGVAAFTLFTAALSAKLKSSFSVIIADFVLLIGPAFLTFSKSSGLWNHILYLLPVRALAGKEVIRIFNSYQIGGVVISYLAMVVIVYTGAGALSLLWLWKHNWTLKK